MPRLSAQPHRSRRLISSACGRLVLADDPPASDRQFFGVRKTHQIDRARDLPGVDNTRDPTQNGETDVDQEVAVAASFEEDSKRRQEECQEVEAHVGGGRRHDDCGLWWRVVGLKGKARVGA